MTSPEHLVPCIQSNARRGELIEQATIHDQADNPFHVCATYVPCSRVALVRFSDLQSEHFADARSSAHVTTDMPRSSDDTHRLVQEHLRLVYDFSDHAARLGRMSALAHWTHTISCEDLA